MEPIVIDVPGPVPAHLFTLLKDHLPHSFTLLRRSQFTHLPGGTSAHAHFLLATARQGPRCSGDELTPPPRHFAAAYLDLSQHPETQLYLYSTLQDSLNDKFSKFDEETVEHDLDLCTALFHRVRLIAEATPAAARGRPHGVMVGNFHEATFRLLVERRGLMSAYWNPHDVWLFQLTDLAPAATDTVVGEGLSWSVVRCEDVPLIASRTNIPKVTATLMVEPSLAVRDAHGTLVAWAFMGTAGTLSTLHVEQSYRGRGLAKALATRILREHSFGDDPWGAADVHVDNIQSQGLCKSLGAKKGMRTCWSVIEFDSMP